MRAFVCHQLSDDRSGLRFEPDWAEPQPPGPDEILVAVTAAALNFPDLLMLSGGYQFRPETPFIPGTEACGIVSAGGAQARHPPGTRVIIGARGGCFAERITVPASAARPVPAGLSDPEAAAFTVGALTAWVGLVERGRLRAGEHLLVTGAGGGMGLAAVGLGAALGAEVTAIASSPDRLAAARSAGAHHGVLIDRTAPAIALSDIDLVFDPVGGALFLPAVATLRRNGRYLVIGFAGGRPAVCPLDRAVAQEIEIIGVRAGEQGRQNPAGASAHIAAIDSHAARTRPHIGMALPLESAANGFAAMAEGRLIGKAVVTIAR